jgi:hypothetical protein
MEAHVQELVDRHGCELRISAVEPPNAFMGGDVGWRREAIVTTRPIRSRLTYYTALDELAHVNHGHFRKDCGELYLEGRGVGLGAAARHFLRLIGPGR